MKKLYSALGIFLLLICITHTTDGSNSQKKALKARIESEFMLSPITINLEGIDPNGNPAVYTIVLQPRAGYINGTFPVTVGSEEVRIPEMPIEFPPVFPGMMNGPGGPFAVSGLSGPNTTGSSIVFSATLPETVVGLPAPVSSDGGNLDLALDIPLDLVIDPVSFSVTDVSPAPHPIPVPYPVVATVSSINVREIKISLSELGIPEYHGQLRYSLAVEDSGHAQSWNWSVSGVWDVMIRYITSGTCFADLRHTRTGNQTGGTLLYATDPGIPRVDNLAAEKLAGGDDEPPSFKIQFSRRSPGGKHTLTFKDTLMGKISTQSLNNVAYIALGQWMRRMGDPSLKVSAPYTGHTPVSWTIPVSSNQKMTLEWIME
ncbi:hypothetical protein ACFLT9_06765 [Acidobacteriota bacterium]